MSQSLRIWTVQRTGLDTASDHFSSVLLDLNHLPSKYKHHSLATVAMSVHKYVDMKRVMGEWAFHYDGWSNSEKLYRYGATTANQSPDNCQNQRMVTIAAHFSNFQRPVLRGNKHASSKQNRSIKNREGALHVHFGSTVL